MSTTNYLVVPPFCQLCAVYGQYDSPVAGQMEMHEAFGSAYCGPVDVCQFHLDAQAEPNYNDPYRCELCGETFYGV